MKMIAWELFRTYSIIIINKKHWINKIFSLWVFSWKHLLNLESGMVWWLDWSEKLKDWDKQNLTKLVWFAELTLDLDDPIKSGWDPKFIYFSNVFFYRQRLFFYIYIFSWLLIPFKIHYINTRKIFYFFKVEFEAF
jgi:hypothetical protein